MERLCIGANGAVLAIDDESNYYHRVVVFDSNGDFLQYMGGYGSLDGQWKYKPEAVLYTKEDQYLVITDNELSYWSSDFNHLITRRNTYASLNAATILPDGLAITLDDSSSEYELGLVDGFNRYGPWTFLGDDPRGIAALPNGDLVITLDSQMRIQPKTYLNSGTALSRTGIPQPTILSVTQRPNSTYVDIDYKVIDTDSATVNTQLIVYTNPQYYISNLDGQTRIALDGVMIPVTFVEGTEVNIGGDVASNTIHRVTWNAGADWDAEVGDIRIEILAKDERGLHPLHWVTIPGEDGAPDLTKLNGHIDSSSLYSIWVWLLATKDPSVTLVDGEIVGVGGTYDGVELFAKDYWGERATTSEGYNFLLALLGIEKSGSNYIPAQ